MPSHAQRHPHGRELITIRPDGDYLPYTLILDISRAKRGKLNRKPVWLRVIVAAAWRLSLIDLVRGRRFKPVLQKFLYREKILYQPD